MPTSQKSRQRPGAVGELPWVVGQLVSTCRGTLCMGRGEVTADSGGWVCK